jgi:hypothetical protein
MKLVAAIAAGLVLFASGLLTACRNSEPADTSNATFTLVRSGTLPSP